jgi:hypothetical protein
MARKLAQSVATSVHSLARTRLHSGGRSPLGVELGRLFPRNDLILIGRQVQTPTAVNFASGRATSG